MNERTALFSVFVQRLIPSFTKDKDDVPLLVECMQESCTKLRRCVRVVNCLTTAMLKPVREADMALMFLTIASLRETVPEMLVSYNVSVLSMRSWCLPHEREVFLQEHVRTYSGKLDMLEAVLFAIQRRF